MREHIITHGVRAARSYEPCARIPQNVLGEMERHFGAICTLQRLRDFGPGVARPVVVVTWNNI